MNTIEIKEREKYKIVTILIGGEPIYITVPNEGTEIIINSSFSGISVRPKVMNEIIVKFDID